MRMNNPIQINNVDEGETIEIPMAEYEAIKAVAAGIADQNALVLDAIKTMQATIQEQGENLVATFAAFKDVISGLNIVVNVPQQPAPIVNVTMPEQPPAQVTVRPTPEKKRKIIATVKRDKNGAISGIEGTTE